MFSPSLNKPSRGRHVPAVCFEPRLPALQEGSLPMSYHDNLVIIVLSTPTVLSNETENGRNQTVRKKCFLFTYKVTQHERSITPFSALAEHLTLLLWVRL